MLLMLFRKSFIIFTCKITNAEKYRQTFATFKEITLLLQQQTEKAYGLSGNKYQTAVKTITNGIKQQSWKKTTVLTAQILQFYVNCKTTPGLQ